MAECVDSLIVGGGPAGLTAAVYLGRFRRQAVLVDGGQSRAGWIPRTRNLSGFPDGIAGADYLDRLRQQAAVYGCTPLVGEVRSLAHGDDGGFVADLGDRRVAARTVILATGVAENPPPVPHLVAAVRRGVIRACPICDGYEAIGRRIAVLGEGAHAAAEALFLRTYVRDLSVVLVGAAPLPAETGADLSAAGIALLRVDPAGVEVKDHDMAIVTAGDGTQHRFDAVYTAFGTTSQTQLAAALGARMDEAGCLIVSAHQQTSVPGLYAAGDLVRGLNQISVANGEAAIAATAVHNALPRVPA